MNNSERKNKRRRFLALILAVALIFGNALIINTAYAQSSTGSDDGANLSLYKAAGITYHEMTTDHYVTPVTPTYYTLYSIKEVPSEGYFKVETKTEEIEKELPTTATLVLNSTGSYTRTTAIKWTVSSETNEKVTFAGKVSLPYDVVNPKGISLDLVYTAILTNKKPLTNSMIIFEDDIEDEKTANMFELKKTYTYEGAQICPEIRQVYWDGDVKEIDGKVKISFFSSVFTKDYTVTYGENKDIGKGTVTLTPNEDSEFIGSVTREFDIVKGEKLEVTYQKKDNYTYYPAADEADELSFRPDIKETPDRLSYKVTYDGSKVTSKGNKAKNVAEAIAMITKDADGFIHVKREIPHGDYNITFTSPNFKESGKFCIHVSEEKMKSVTYVLNGGSVYAKNEQGKEIEISRDRFVDYFKEDNLKNGAYIVRVGNSYKKYEYVVKKGNQDPDKGKVLKFRGW
nr:hypothetical protein [Eubacterium sp.]